MADDDVIGLVVDGTRYVLSTADVTSNDVNALRQATGLSLRRLFALAGSDIDIDVIAAIVWLSRRVNGERRLAFEKVAGEIGYSTDFDLSDDAEADPPEA